MRIRIHRGSRAWELAFPRDTRDGRDRATRVPALLEEAMKGDENVPALRRLLHRLGVGDVACREDAEIRVAAAALVRRGALSWREVIPADATLGSAEGADAVEPAPSEPAGAEAELSFLEIAMIGEDDQPIPGVRYRVWSPSSTESIEGDLDDDGFARVVGIREGRWRITFPDLDEGAWVFLDEVAPRRAARRA